jgi:hypothetical protein
MFVRYRRVTALGEEPRVRKLHAIRTARHALAMDEGLRHSQLQRANLVGRDGAAPLRALLPRA